jgi:hypothetical protein
MYGVHRTFNITSPLFLKTQYHPSFNRHEAVPAVHYYFTIHYIQKQLCSDQSSDFLKSEGHSHITEQ